MPSPVDFAMPFASDRELSILMIHGELPLYDRHAGSLRIWRTLELLAAEGHHITYLARQGLNQEAYADKLRALGIEVHAYDAPWLRSRGLAIPGPGPDVPALLRRSRFDLAWIHFYDTAEQYLPQIRLHSPATRILIDTCDVHHVRERRGAELAGDPALMAAAERTREREQAIYSQADLLMAVSDADAGALRELAPEVETAVLGTIHTLPPAGPAFDEREGLLFVGNFAHAPNVDAMLAFHSTTWPAVQAALPGAHLTIVGNEPPAAVQGLAGPSVTVTGWVPETAPYVDGARLSIAPLRYGAGVKGKIGEAMSHGLPVVTTPVGAEGMDLTDGETALIADTPEQFAAAVARLHRDRALWERLAAQGRDYVDGRYGATAARAAVRSALDAAVSGTFVAQLEPGDDAGLRTVLGGYLGAFAPADDVTLFLPVPEGGRQLEQAFASVLETVRALGHDPESVPDVAVVPSADVAPTPACAVRVGQSGRGGPALDPAAPADAWRSAACAGVEDGRPRASIVMCAYNNRAYSERCLASLEERLGSRLGTSWELVLVDNGSSDDTRALFERWRDRARLVLLDQNANYAGGANAGARAASGRTLIFINNDTEVAPGALEALVEEAERPDAGVVGARLVYPDGRLQHGGFGWRRTEHGVLPFHLFHFEAGDLPAASASYETSCVTGAVIAVPSNVYDAIGGWHEGYAQGWEDADLCMGARAAGARIRYRGDAVIVHHEGVTAGSNHGANGNLQTFLSRWAPALGDDAALLHATFGAVVSPLIDLGTPADALDGAAVRVVGPVAGLGPDAAEARGLLRALGAAGVEAAARTIAPTWLGPDLGEREAAQLAAAHARPARPGALTIQLGSEPDRATGGKLLLRVASVPAERPDGAVAIAASNALTAELRAAGWPDDCVSVLPPAGIDVPAGPGGSGVLALLPAHDAGATEALLDALTELDSRTVRIVPSVWSRELAQTVATRLPGAALLQPVTDEHALGALAATADVVVAADAADRFDRAALVAAAAGAAVVVRPGGPAAELLDGLCAAADPSEADAIALAIAAAEYEGDRNRRSDTVRAACGPEAAPDLRALVGGAEPRREAAHAHHAGLEAFAKGDLDGARYHLARALRETLDTDVLNDLAVACHAAGDLVTARGLLQACVLVAPEDKAARDNLASVEAELTTAPER